MPLLCPCSNCGCRFGSRAMGQLLETTEYYTDRIKHLLATNDIPVDEEIRNFATISAEKEAVRSKVNRQIKRLEDSMYYLVSLRNKTNQELAKYNIIRSPHRHLPNDVLSEIFFRCVHENLIQQNIDRIGNKKNIITSLDRRLAPWVLTRVSKRWRAIALSLPRLWSTISVNIPWDTYPGSSENIRCMQALALQLQRSRTCLLSVTLKSSSTLTSSHTLAVLMSSSPRWKKLLTAVPIHSYRDLYRLEGNLPSLEEFYGLTTVDNSPPLEFTGLRGAPMLKKVASLPGILNHISIHTPQITVAEVINAQVTCKMLNLVLPRLPFLERASFPCPSAGGDLGGTNITMTRLRYLSLPMSSSILANLTLPALTTLSLKGDISVDTVLSHIQRSGCTVREIKIASDDIVEADCTRLLNELSALEVVAIFTKYAHMPAFIEGLFETPGHFMALHKLTLKGVEAVDPASLVHIRDAHPAIVIME
ncbi:uncharacterized protein ARMOST_16050 [Armillaria ostoyae]|uniref:Uncharacterized protein n=1 Tax=Armillaria ostoyae TaxID=47428 RepID=A0A284RV36_ARMOS|nr:uncharacterized protein ARMOST_16050 [Armillaria ostoyae]